jgi:AP-4 complex subunit epsilon-1
VATTLLTPLAEVEAESSFSPTLMVVLTALACEYAGRVPVSPLQLLHGLSRRLTSYSGPSVLFGLGVFFFAPAQLTFFTAASIQEVSLLAMMRLAAECQKIPPEPISDVHHLGSISGRHISRVSNPRPTLLPHHRFLTMRSHQRCSQFEDMIGKPDELRAAVVNSRSRSVRDHFVRRHTPITSMY